ncbi:MAG: DHA2 family efflux MFS transporter permease subunit, partial [Rhodospirillales bacterium]|nr:DHA2 family efflux MFS transporter permease subunit [Rhodospirillales bacterium]
AFAWNIESMIVFRALQGFLGGAMIPTVFATSFLLFPPRIQPGISVMTGLVATMAPTLGPSLGGWITQNWSWHWLFLVNVLPGLIVCAAVFTCVRVDRPNLSLLKGFDLAGIVFIALFLGCLEYMLEEGPRDDWFQSDTILAVAIVSAGSAGLFFWRELTAAKPVVDLHAFKDRNFALGCTFSFVIGLGLYGSVYLVPVYLGRVLGYNSLEIGITMMVTGLFQVLSAPLAGALARKLDSRLLLACGLSLFGLGLGLNSGVTSAWGYWDLFLPQAVRGLSLMLCFVPINTITLGRLPPHQVQNASGLYNLMRNLGGAIGLAILTTSISDRFDLHSQRLGESLTTARYQVIDVLDG